MILQVSLRKLTFGNRYYSLCSTPSPGKPQGKLALCSGRNENFPHLHLLDQQRDGDDFLDPSCPTVMATCAFPGQPMYQTLWTELLSNYVHSCMSPSWYRGLTWRPGNLKSSIDGLSAKHGKVNLPSERLFK